ncbi:MAG TPA: TonB-dependent receptor [Steroidobacteraceae bacterium]
MFDTYRSSALTSVRCAVAFTMAVLLASGVKAGESSEALAALPEVVVTATKVGAQQLSQVPMAIQAFTGETLQSQGIRDAKDLMELIPGASEQSEIGAGYKIFSFRGSGAGGPVGDGMIGYYLDDTPFGIPNNQSAPPVQYFDLERVEVLRGPQGTLYGSGSMGGVIIYHTRNPSLSHFTVDGEIDSSKTSDAGQLNYRTSAAVSVPLISGQLAVRLSGGYDYRAGYADVYQGAPVGAPYKTDANDIHSSDAQAVLLWKPTDQLTLRLRAWQFQTNQDYLQVMNSVRPPYFAYQGTVNGYDRRKGNYFSNTLTYDLGDVVLTNATSYQDSPPGGFGVALNLGPPLGIGTLVNGGNAHNFVNELRLSSAGKGPFHWVGGSFYQNATSVYFYNINFPTLAINGGTTTRTRNASAFGELSYDLFDGKLVPLVGLRYFEDHRSADSQSGGVPAFSSAKPTAVTWRANIAYHMSENWMLFINAGTGFRSGILQSQAQANAVIADGVPSALALTPDKLRNIEIGTKATLASGRIRLATSVYDIRSTNLQSAFNTSIGLAAFANLGGAKTQGLDLEVTWVTPVDGLDVSLIGNLNKAEFTDVIPAFAAANPRNGDGARLFNTPPHNWRLDLNYEREIGAGWGMFANTSAALNGSARIQDANVDSVSGYTLYNASIGARKGPYEVRIYGENLSDERGPTAANGPTLLAGPYPRTLGVGVRVRVE